MWGSIGVGLFNTLLVLSGCATAYQPRGFTGGYTDRRIDASTLHVSFRGNGYTPRQTVEIAAFYRCAELTVGAGYDSFAVVSGNIDVSQMMLSFPGSCSSVTVGGATAFGGTATGWAATYGTYTPGTVVPVSKFDANIICRAFSGSPSGAGLDARDVLERLGPSLGQRALISLMQPSATTVEPERPVQCPGTSVWSGQGCITLADPAPPTTTAAARPPVPCRQC